MCDAHMSVSQLSCDETIIFFLLIPSERTDSPQVVDTIIMCAKCSFTVEHIRTSRQRSISTFGLHDATRTRCVALARELIGGSAYDATCFLFASLTKRNTPTRQAPSLHLQHVQIDPLCDARSVQSSTRLAEHGGGVTSEHRNHENRTSGSSSHRFRCRRSECKCAAGQNMQRCSLGLPM